MSLQSVENVTMKTTTALSAMLVIAFGLSAPCLARPKGVTVIQVKNIALQQCLHDSYSRITPDGDGRLRHDSSYLIQRYALTTPGSIRRCKNMSPMPTKISINLPCH